METEQALCAMCHINNFKYTCPACGIRTCCIVCVKRHKKQNECTGVVDKTKFVGRKELVESAAHLNRDYNFLLNVERQIQLGKGDIKNSAKNVFKRNFNSSNSSIINSNNSSVNKNDHNGNNRNKRFKPAAHGKSSIEDDARLATIKEVYPNDPAVVVKRQNTLVIQVHPGMARATTNKSGYDKKSGSFIWTVEWILLGSDGEVVTQFVSYKLKEHLVLGDAVPMNILNNSKSEKTKRTDNEEKHKGELMIENKPDNIDITTDENERKDKAYIIGEEKEKKYIKIDKIDKSQLHLYIDNVLSSDKSQRSVFALDKSMTIAEVLKDKVVLEYPTFFITTNEEVIANAVVSLEEASKIKKNVEESESGSSDSDSDSGSNSSESSDSDSASESSDEDDGPEEESSRPPEHVRFEDDKSTLEEIVTEEQIEKVTVEDEKVEDEQSNPEHSRQLTSERSEEVWTNTVLD